MKSAEEFTFVLTKRTEIEQLDFVVGYCNQVKLIIRDRCKTKIARDIMHPVIVSIFQHI